MRMLFLDFGGVPRAVRLDNLKAGVSRACLYDPEVSELCATFPERWGFVRCPVDRTIPRNRGLQDEATAILRQHHQRTTL
jgi:hypothetical protein